MAGEASSTSGCYKLERLVVETPVKKLRQASKPTFTMLPNVLLDEWMPALSEAEFKVACAIARATYGWHLKDTDLSLTDLQRKTGISRTAVRTAVETLIEKSLISRTPKGQSFTYSLVLAISNSDTVEELPAISDFDIATVSKSDIALCQNLTPPIDKERLNKKKKETHTKRAGTKPPAVGVRSRYSLVQCRAYADHLRSIGDGISNPGGYATTIHRSGAADELIAAFLQNNSAGKSLLPPNPNCHICEGDAAFTTANRQPCLCRICQTCFGKGIVADGAGQRDCACRMTT